MGIRSQMFFTDEEKQRIDAAVKQAESTTSGEIVPVLAGRSGPYDRALFYAALMTVFLATIGVVGFFLLPIPFLEHEVWEIPLFVLLPVQLIALFGGYYAADRFPGFQRAFVPHALMQRRVDQMAKVQFYALRLTHTQASTGIMVYVSLFERAIVVLADKAINETHAQSDWDQVRDLLADGLKNDRAADGFVAALAECGRILTKHFPIQEDDINELPNNLRII